MNYKAPLLILGLGLISVFASAQTISANAGLGPGNSFTLFLVFQSPMPNVKNINCSFSMPGTPKPGQQDFNRGLACSGPPIKTDETHYAVKVDVPMDIAAGDYVINSIGVLVDDVSHPYTGTQLPSLSPVRVENPKHVEFSPLKKLEVN